MGKNLKLTKSLPLCGKQVSICQKTWSGPPTLKCAPLPSSQTGIRGYHTPYEIILKIYIQFGAFCGIQNLSGQLWTFVIFRTSQGNLKKGISGHLGGLLSLLVQLFCSSEQHFQLQHFP